jgi:hypothetical protein
MPVVESIVVRDRLLLCWEGLSRHAAGDGVVAHAVKACVCANLRARTGCRKELLGQSAHALLTESSRSGGSRLLRCGGGGAPDY